MPRPNLVITFVAIDPHMVVMYVQVSKNLVEDVLLDGRSGMNIMTKGLQKWLEFPSPKLTLYTIGMADQTITKLVRLIKNLKIYIHGIPYIVMFTIMKNNVLDSNYSMLLIVVTKHLDNNTKCLEVLFCYDMMEGVIDEEAKIPLTVEFCLFTLKTITLPKL